MYYQVIQIEQIERKSTRKYKTWGEIDKAVLECYIAWWPIEKYVILDQETADKYGVESEITAEQLFSKIDFYNEEVVDRNIIEKCVIVDRDGFKERRIPEFHEKLEYDDRTRAYTIIESFGEDANIYVK